MMTCQLLLTVALLAPAQPPANGDPNVYRRAAPRADSHETVYEQIEVMRSLLIRKLQGRGMSAHAPVWTTSNPNPAKDEINDLYHNNLQSFYYYGQNDASRMASVTAAGDSNVEGAYIDGSGVVLTITLPISNRDPRPGAAEPQETPGLSDWDQEQRRLRGESPPARAAAPPKQIPVGDVLLKLLAENGKHFTGLKDDERVTLAVTFRGHGPQLVSGPATFTGTIGGNAGSSVTLTTPAGTPNAGVGAAVEDRLSALILLGDLHLKQGEPQAAIEAFQKAVVATEHESKENPGSEEARRHLRTAYGKLAQAQLAAGKDNEARALMDRAAAMTAKAGMDQKAEAKSKTFTRPGRLTISAPKRLLEQVGGGKMSMDDFRREVTVEYVAGGKPGE